MVKLSPRRNTRHQAMSVPYALVDRSSTHRARSASTFTSGGTASLRMRRTSADPESPSKSGFRAISSQSVTPRAYWSAAVEQTPSTRRSGAM